MGVLGPVQLKLQCFAVDTVNIIYCTQGRGTNQHDSMAISISALLRVSSEPCDERAASTASA